LKKTTPAGHVVAIDWMARLSRLRRLQCPDSPNGIARSDTENTGGVDAGSAGSPLAQRIICASDTGGSRKRIE
jgi:hypothetical protein